MLTRHFNYRGDKLVDSGLFAQWPKYRGDKLVDSGFFCPVWGHWFLKVIKRDLTGSTQKYATPYVCQVNITGSFVIGSDNIKPSNLTALTWANTRAD